MVITIVCLSRQELLLRANELSAVESESRDSSALESRLEFVTNSCGAWEEPIRYVS